MIYLEEAVEGALQLRGLQDIWWGAAILEAWPHVVGLRYAERATPILAKSPIAERGLLTVAVPHPTWTHQLSFLNIADRLNERLGRRMVRQVRFEVQGKDA